MKKEVKTAFKFRKKVIAKLSNEKLIKLKGGNLVACTEMDTFCPCNAA